MHRVLVIDDEQDLRYILKEILSKRGLSISEASNGMEAIKLFNHEKFDAVLLDHNMPEMDGLQTMAELKKIDPSVPVIFVTAYSEIPVAVEAIRSGAYDFITKPPDFEKLALTIKRAIEKNTLEQEVKRLNTAVGASVEGLLGKSALIKRIIGQLNRVASSDFSIIIQGETGTGKSTVAELIHNMSKRVHKPFTRVDISVIPETLVESELFGYEKGAFTGAEKNKRGYFDIANTGTIFIDELENMSHNVQSKLLSVVEQKKIYHMGGTKQVPLDIRIISAANRDLKQLVNEKKFREDLYFRLNEFTITLPPLRERMEDVEFLAERFCSEACFELDKKPLEITGPALDLLKNYRWPGNVRELKNVIRRAALLSTGYSIMPDDINLIINCGPAPEGMPAQMLPLKETSAIAAREAEVTAIKNALGVCGGNKSKASNLLKVDYKTLLTKIKQFSIE
ncbi:MAG: sigma-54-dependent Fis family transcriptional regulator [Deltaproteobacteria bacterium]|nr:sigma-54-dependent Fis family transcriptional regulator [Deltaproteobacteria bacterium]